MTPKKGTKIAKTNRGGSGQWSRACITCRRRKKKCAGGHPCPACLENNYPCTYDVDEFVTSSASAILVDAFHMLRNKTPQERTDDFKYLEKTNDGTLIMARLRLNKWVELEKPPVRERCFVNLELEDRHPSVYPLHHPPEIDKLDVQTRRIVDWPGESLDAILPDVTSLAIYKCLYPSPEALPPTPTSQFKDPRLDGPVLRPWTTVPIGEAMATQVLRYYLNTDHPLYGPFHAEPFIRDLVSENYNYCSSLLVNSLMYWACQNYIAIESQVQPFVDLFRDEAEIQWQTERILPSRLTMISSVFLGLGHLAQGKIGAVHYLQDAASIGIGLGLYKGGDYEIVQDEWSGEEINAAAYASWGVFNVVMMVSVFYFQFQTDYPHTLPFLSIPQDPRKLEDESFEPNADETPEWYSTVFTKACEFWSIMHELAIEYRVDFTGNSPITPSFMLAEFKFRELLAFSDLLPSELIHQKNSPPCVTLFHIWFHCAVLSIFQPFFTPSGSSKHEFRTFSTSGSSPDLVVKASSAQLRRLVLDYRLRHESLACSFNWQTSLLYLMNSLVHEEPSEEVYFYFHACLFGYKKLAYFPVIDHIVKSLLSLMVANGHVSNDNARITFNEIWEGIKNRSKEARAAANSGAGLVTNPDENVQAFISFPFMVDLRLAWTEPEEATGDYMSDSFDLNLLEVYCPRAYENRMPLF